MAARHAKRKRSSVGASFGPYTHSHLPPCPASALQAPLAAALLFAAYLAVALLYGVVTFRTVPEEAELLQKVGRQAVCAANAPGDWKDKGCQGHLQRGSDARDAGSWK